MIVTKGEQLLITEKMVPSELAVTIDDVKELVSIFNDLRMRYDAAMKEVSTKLEVLDMEYSVKNDYNPIHNMECRLKSINSIIKKIKKKDWPMEVESVYKLTDFAGVRVVCNYIADIYEIEESLIRQDDIKLIERKDYIREPKESGYRSLHLLVEVPIFLSERTHHMIVEIQIRTIAMDTWASLEHELKYKREEALPEDVIKELQKCAKSIAEIDMKMGRIHRML